jgi:hypothetical protein
MFNHNYFGNTYFGPSYFGGAVAALARITSTRILQLPIDAVLAGQQPIKEIGNEYDIRAVNRRERGRTMRSGVRALSGAKPSFTIRSSRRGYE